MLRIVETAQRTDVGRRMKANEDGVIVLEDVPLIAVSDGTGGTEPARICLDTLSRYAPKLGAYRERVIANGDVSSRLGVARFFEQVLTRAGQAIAEEASTANLHAMAATAVAATVMGRFGYVAHIGNSRGYLFRDGALRCLTVDHTLAMQQLRSGAIDAAGFADSPYKKTLTQALGVTPDLHPDIAEVRLAPGDVVLLCSDGLYRMVGEEDIARVLREARSLDTAAEILVAAANQAGGKDNIGVALLKVDAASEDDAVAPDGEHFMELAQSLNAVFIFKDLSEAERRLVAPYFEQRTVAVGETLCREGDQGDSFFVIVSGHVDITHGDVHLIALGPGGYAGEISLARAGKRTATLTAATEADILVLTRARFLELIRRRPSLGARLAMPLLRNVGGRIVDLRQRLETIRQVLSGE